ncbi:SDR family NAD(P)-dependent oxidoreductase [Taibaiella chishuiensis]|uniref:3-oxoacyl-[acyl-carrier protein] reductase n=1 Tax=Taibaiella chishuiensis TaxID=1434707 RepID=A0A2P8D7U9_9BACT|nr:3-oxoacyl-ACP reductase family protein [Taibaiella chishuiensis]PSK93306.1 3-oxoacyl-[acyl-carrier protein] reductase [Taibaiella chishuiensis]
MTRFKDKVAFVTGGSRGIGAAIVKRLAAEGAHVVFTYVSAGDKARAVVQEVEAAGGNVLAVQTDSGDAKAVAEAIEQTVADLGRLDILVNNAGVFVTAPAGDPANDLDALDRQIDINIRAVVTAVRTAARHMGEGGRIISIGSVNGSRAGFAGVAEYGGSKAAVAGYTRGWAWDLGKRGITVNTIQPGPVDTDMNPDNGDFAAMLKAGMPLGRYGRSEEVASAVAYLASTEAGFITGTTLNVDGGLNA